LTNSLVRNLAGFAEASTEDREVIELLCAHTRVVPAGTPKP
jgi:hypothetical protein